MAEHVLELSGAARTVSPRGNVSDTGMRMPDVVPGERCLRGDQASSMQPKRSDKSGRYLDVLKRELENGLSLDNIRITMSINYSSDILSKVATIFDRVLVPRKLRRRLFSMVRMAETMRMPRLAK